MKSLKWRGGVALSSKCMKRGLADTVDNRERALYLDSVEVVREIQKKNNPGILSTSSRMG